MKITVKPSVLISVGLHAWCNYHLSLHGSTCLFAFFFFYYRKSVLLFHWSTHSFFFFKAKNIILSTFIMRFILYLFLVLSITIFEISFWKKTKKTKTHYTAQCDIFYACSRAVMTQVVPLSTVFVESVYSTDKIIVQKNQNYDLLSPYSIYKKEIRSNMQQIVSEK